MSTIHPVLALWLKVTAVIALAIVAVTLMGFLAKIFIIAAVLGSVVIGALFLYSVVRRRGQLPTVR